MPTFETLARFARDYAKLTPEQQTRFRKVLTESFIPDLAGDGSFRRDLRVKGVQAAPGVFEMTWAPDGRATSQYGDEVRPGETHIIWRRVGTHDIFDPPPGP